MRKQFYYLISFLVIFSSSILSCETNMDMPTCEDSRQPLITRGFSVAIEVMFADTVPWQGLATMDFEKTYCSGETSGHHSFTDFCDEDGYYYPGAVPTYDLDNEYDKVTIIVSIIKDPEHGLQLHHEVTYYYVDVKPLLLGVDEIYEIFLPWASWEN